jgi:hypothetical protein
MLLETLLEFLNFWGVENYGARLWSTLLTIAVDLDS